MHEFNVSTPTQSAARVSIASRIESNQSCKHAYSVYVEQQFNLLSHQPTTNELSEAPVLLNGSIIHTSSSNCEECPGLTVGSTYLIAGQYHTNGDGTTVWELPNGKSSSLASKWQDKYSRKLQEWIDDANDVRRQGI